MRIAHSRRQRCAATSGLMIAAALVVVPAVPALAETTTVSSKADLQTQLGRDGATVVLGVSLTAADAQHDSISTPAGATVVLDLRGRRLQLQRLTVGTGGTLQIVDSAGPPSTSSSYDDTRGLQVGTSSDPYAGSPDPDPDRPAGGVVVGSSSTLRVSGATLYAFGSYGTAGIGSPAGSSATPGRLVTTGGTRVTAVGGNGASGIGGGPEAAAISVQSTDSLISASGGAGGAGIGGGRDAVSAGGLQVGTTPWDGHGGFPLSSLITAFGGTGAAAVGGGLHGSGATVALSGGTSMNAWSTTDPSLPGAPSTIGAGQGATASSGSFGSLSVDGGSGLFVQHGDLILPADGVVRNSGFISLRGAASGAGTIENLGRIDFPSDGPTSGGPQEQVDPGGRMTVDHVTGNNFAVTLDGNGSTTPSRVVRVYQDTIDTDGLPEPEAPAPGQVLTGWNPRADGRGIDPYYRSLAALFGGTSTDGSPVEGRLYAQYDEPARFTSSFMPTAKAGSDYDEPLPITGGGIRSYSIAQYDDHQNPIPGLPAGLRLSGDGRIRGIPTEKGVFRFRVNGHGKRAVSSTITLEVLGTPIIATDTLPDGELHQPYAVQLVATGDGAITWDAADDDLPAGLHLSQAGVLSGTPDEAGWAGFTVTARNDLGSTSRQLSVFVVDPSPPGGSTDEPGEEGDPDEGGDPDLGDEVDPGNDDGLGVPAVDELEHGTTTAEPPQPSLPTVPSSPAAQASAPTAAAVPTPAAAVAVAAPTVATVPRTTVRFGHSVDLAVAASSVVPVSWSMTGALPKGLAFDRSTGAIKGVAGEEGLFRVTVSATSSAGSASTEVVIVVPAVEELIDTKPVPAVKAGAGDLPVGITGLQKGERWKVVVDGRTVKTGTMKQAGPLRTSVPLKPVKRDTVHRIVITGSRTVADPAQRASTAFTITSLAAKKDLDAKVSQAKGRTVVSTDHLAAGESVLVRVDGKAVARGRANDEGEYVFTAAKLRSGKHRIVLTGATQKRTDAVIVKTKRG